MELENNMYKYLVIFEKARDNYSAYSPDLPGCIATGKTRQETEKNIKEAINLHIDGLKEDGLPLPESSSFTEYIEIEGRASSKGRQPLRISIPLPFTDIPREGGNRGIGSLNKM